MRRAWLADARARSVDASGGDTTAVVLIRGPAIVNRHEITIPGSPTAPQIAAAHAALLTLGILVRQPPDREAPHGHHGHP